MKTKFNTFTRLFGMNGLVYGLGILAITLLFSACERGRDGRDGRAFLALDWQNDEPDYVDAGTASIPRSFQWSKYYNIWPGYYNMYYDGEITTPNGYAEYAWEMDYEVYNLEGERAYYYMDGEDAPDTYFSIACTPYGPEFYDEGSTYKSAPSIAEPKEYTVTKTVKNMVIKLHARPVEKRATK
jgi:hypothetical protein